MIIGLIELPFRQDDASCSRKQATAELKYLIHLADAGAHRSLRSVEHGVLSRRSDRLAQPHQCCSGRRRGVDRRCCIGGLAEKSKIPNTRLEIIDAAHISNVEAGDRFTVSSFLE